MTSITKRIAVTLVGICCWALATLAWASLAGAAEGASRHSVIFQYSTLSALAAGVYDGDLSFGTLKHHGDLGIGTFNGLDGEMIALGGKFYQIKSDGVAYPVANSQKTPFALVTFFTPAKSVDITESLDFQQLQTFLDGQLPSANLLYAVKLTGRFHVIKTRSVPRQTPPYQPLAEAAKKQAVFEFREVEGTVVGFRLPEYMQGLNLSGYHCHFLTADGKAGGHLLDCRVGQVKAEIAVCDRFFLSLPGGDFVRQDLSRDRRPELEKIEKYQSQ